MGKLLFIKYINASMSHFNFYILSINTHTKAGSQTHFFFQIQKIHPIAIKKTTNAASWLIFMNQGCRIGAYPYQYAATTELSIEKK